MFSIVATIVLGVLSLSSFAAASPLQARNGLTLYNGQNVTFDYSDSTIQDNTLFGMGLTKAGAATPDKVTSYDWEGPVVLNIGDMDKISATYILQYPFFKNGTSYTVQLFQYNTTTLDVVQPQIHNATFTWVNQPGQDV